MLSAEFAKVSYVQIRDTRVSISKPQDNTGCPSFQLLIYGIFFPWELREKHAVPVEETDSFIDRTFIYLIFCLTWKFYYLIS